MIAEMAHLQQIALQLELRCDLLRRALVHLFLWCRALSASAAAPATGQGTATTATTTATTTAAHHVELLGALVLVEPPRVEARDLALELSTLRRRELR